MSDNNLALEGASVPAFNINKNLDKIIKDKNEITNNNSLSEVPAGPTIKRRTKKVLLYNGKILTSPSGTEYTIDKKVGSGQYGTVWKAYSNDQVFAIKVIARKSVDALKFYAEINILKTLKTASACNNRILCYQESWTDDNNYYLVSNFIPGPNLFYFNQMVHTQKIKISAEQIRQILLKIAAAVAYLHAQGIAHRDIKPENIQIDMSTFNPTLIDLGLSCFTTTKFPRCKPNERVGSPVFSAPELLIGRVDDFFAVDIYALGVVFFESVMGKNLINSKNEQELIKDILSGNRTKIDTGNMQLDVLLTQMLAKSPLQRITADEVVNSLESQSWSTVPILQ